MIYLSEKFLYKNLNLTFKNKEKSLVNIMENKIILFFILFIIAKPLYAYF